MALTPVQKYHTQQAKVSETLYILSQTASSLAADWREAVIEARQSIADTLRATSFLLDVPKGLQEAPGLTLVLRSLLAPPISQDQFKLVCKAWNKGREKRNEVLPKDEANAVGLAFDARRDRYLTRWVDANRKPTRREVRELMRAVSPYIGSQRLGTARRNRLAREQEQAVIDLLQAKGWSRVPSKLITSSGALKTRQFCHKTRFATQTNPQEVDIACGLKSTVVLAMECKVTNDKTNSVKRVNDVLKKASAWKTHWGNFVETAALLQGVIKQEDVFRLLDANVHVFWSHDLPRFEAWLSKRV